jgi:hypothetical protein
MNRLCGRSVGSIFALALGTWVLFMGLNPVAEAASTLTFELAEQTESGPTVCEAQCNRLRVRMMTGQKFWTILPITMAFGEN